jgi:hypothetical protein
MNPSLVLALCLFFVLLPFVVLLVILVNGLIAEHRERKRYGWETDPADWQFVQLCYVVLLVAQALKGW